MLGHAIYIQRQLNSIRSLGPQTACLPEASPTPLSRVEPHRRSAMSVDVGSGRRRRCWRPCMLRVSRRCETLVPPRYSIAALATEQKKWAFGRFMRYVAGKQKCTSRTACHEKGRDPSLLGMPKPCRQVQFSYRTRRPTQVYPLVVATFSSLTFPKASKHWRTLAYPRDVRPKLNLCPDAPVSSPTSYVGRQPTPLPPPIGVRIDARGFQTIPHRHTPDVTCRTSDANRGPAQHRKQNPITINPVPGPGPWLLAPAPTTRRAYPPQTDSGPSSMTASIRSSRPCRSSRCSQHSKRERRRRRPRARRKRPSWGDQAMTQPAQQGLPARGTGPLLDAGWALAGPDHARLEARWRARPKHVGSRLEGEERGGGGGARTRGRELELLYAQWVGRMQLRLRLHGASDGHVSSAYMSVACAGRE